MDQEIRLSKVSGMKDAYVTIHGHFYQPPRENPWLEAIELEESAGPFHDWNERIAFECYRPNAFARIVDGQGKILDIVNNYSFLNFNFGPTLLSWMEKQKPLLYQKILEADRESQRRLGHGNAIAQVYDHIIMPLTNEKDRETEVRWGIADFEKRFHRRPEAMWLPETAVHYPTLELLVKHGMRYLILSPFQALRVRPLGGKKWTDVSQGRIDTTQAYRCFLRDRSGRKISDQSIDIFFYDGSLSKEIAFNGLLKDGNLFCDRFAQAYQPSKNHPQLIHVSTDGETYGHHKKFGEMALAYALNNGFSSRGFEVLNYGTFLKRFPPVYEIEIDEGPGGEGTAWSCSHGVGRWKEDCGCSTGGKPGWNQQWRRPLREALNLLRDDLHLLFEKEGEGIFQDPWEAREGYIDLILDRSAAGTDRFFRRVGRSGLDQKGRIEGLKLLEMERHTLRMFTSCGWFFADLAGLETVLILGHAARAIQLAGEFSDQDIEQRFLESLSNGRSNLPEMGDGLQIYRRLVKPKQVTPEQVVNHYAVSSLLGEGEQEKKIFSFLVEKKRVERIEENDRLLLLGEVKVTPEIIPEPGEFRFGLISFGKDLFRTWLWNGREAPSFETLREKGREFLEKNEEEGLTQFFASLPGNRTFTLRDILREKKQEIFRRLMEKEFDEHFRTVSKLFDRTRHSAEILLEGGLEIPLAIRSAAEVTLSCRLLNEAKELKRDFKNTMERGEIDRMIKDAERYGCHLSRREPIQILNEILNEKMELLQKARGADLHGEGELIEDILMFLDRSFQWGFELLKVEAQDRMDGILDECMGRLEESWWGSGAQKPFPPSLIVLAERLGFNVEKISKVISNG